MSEHPTPPAKLAYTVREAVPLLPWKKTKVYELIKSGELPTRFKWGHRYLLHEDLMAVLLSVEPSLPGEGTGEGTSQ